MTHYDEFVKFSNRVFDDLYEDFRRNSDSIDGRKEDSYKKMMEFDKLRKDMLKFLKTSSPTVVSSS